MTKFSHSLIKIKLHPVILQLRGMDQSQTSLVCRDRFYWIIKCQSSIETLISVFTVFNRTWVAIESHYNCCDSILTIAVMFYRGAVWAHPVPPKREGCDSTGFGLLWGYVIVVYVRPHVQHNIRSMYKQNYACLYVYTMFRLSAKICLLEDWTAKKHMKWDFFKWDPNNTWRWFVLWLKSDFYRCISVGLSGRS